MASLLSSSRAARLTMPADTAQSAGPSKSPSSTSMTSFASPKSPLQKLKRWKLSYAGKSKPIPRQESPVPIPVPDGPRNPYEELRPHDYATGSFEPPPAPGRTNGDNDVSPGMSDGERERVESGYDWEAETEPEDEDEDEEGSEGGADVDAYSWIDPSVVGSDEFRHDVSSLSCPGRFSGRLILEADFQPGPPNAPVRQLSLGVVDVEGMIEATQHDPELARVSCFACNMSTQLRERYHKHL